MATLDLHDTEPRRSPGFLVQHRKAVALIILAVGGWGAAISSFFAKTPQPVTILEEPIIWRDTALEPAAVYPPSAVAPAIPTPQTPAAPIAAVVSGDPLLSPVPREPQTPPPALQAAFPNTQPPPASYVIPTEAMRTARLQPPLDPAASSGELGSSTVHEVIDGDTLEGLAQHYLGDATRVEELLALNRDRLPNPDLLPIGLELRIPPQVRQHDRAVRPAALADTPEGTVPGMEAVPAGALRHDVASATQEFAPLPTAVATTAPARTHRVRQGDTLRSIARHYYGDAQRYREIFTANQATLHDINLLPQGAELIVP